jgi:hypothetical protein
MNAAAAVGVSLEPLNWRAYEALAMWKLILPKHITRLDARIWRRFSEVQARRRGFKICNSDFCVSSARHAAKQKGLQR